MEIKERIQRKTFSDGEVTKALGIATRRMLLPSAGSGTDSTRCQAATTDMLDYLIADNIALHPADPHPAEFRLFHRRNLQLLWWLNQFLDEQTERLVQIRNQLGWEHIVRGCGNWQSANQGWVWNQKYRCPVSNDIHQELIRCNRVVPKTDELPRETYITMLFCL